MARREEIQGLIGIATPPHDGYGEEKMLGSSHASIGQIGRSLLGWVNRQISQE